LKKSIGFLVKLAVSLGLLWYLIRHINLLTLWQTISKAQIKWVFLAFLCYVVFQMISTLRWQVISYCLGFRKSYLYFLKLYFINQYFNAFLPGLLGGDIIRMGYLLKDGASKTAATLSVFYDRAFGFLGALVLIIITVPLKGSFLPSGLRHWLLLVTASGICASLFLVFIKSRFKRLQDQSVWSLATEVFTFKAFLALFALGLLVQTLYSVHIFFLGQGLGITLPFSCYLIMVPVMGILASMPVSLGGIGVREGTFVYFLKLLGYGAEYGLALGLLVYGVSLLGGLIGGVVYLMRKAEGASGLEDV